MTRHRTVTLTPAGHAAADAIRRGPGTTIADLTERHHGRTIAVNGIVGRLDGIVPCGGRVVLALTVGGVRMWTDYYPAATPVEVLPTDLQRRVHRRIEDGECAGCGRELDRDLEPSPDPLRCPDCHDDERSYQ